MIINDENIDELMFQILEGEIQGEERSKLLDAIEADKIYSKQWQAWQQTILNPDNALIVMDTKRLLKREKKSFVIWAKYCAAASLVIAIGLAIFYLSVQKSNNPSLVEKPVNPKMQIIKVPSISPVNNNRINDSVISFKQKVQLMAQENNSKSGVKSNNIKVYDLKNNALIIPFEIENYPEISNSVVVQTKTDNLKTVLQDSQLVANNMNEENGVIMTVYNEPIAIKQKMLFSEQIQDKRNLLARVFSMPKLKIINDSSTFTNKKIVIENKAYKIIAGF